MLYRPLGNTGLQVSAIGLGCGMIGSSDTDYAVSLVRRARDRGVTFFDVAHGYRDAEVKLGIALKGDRQNVVISSKTTARTR
jgi:aryl-alcohol dehydrogenase-like predicted oxidoreductase